MVRLARFGPALLALGLGAAALADEPASVPAPAAPAAAGPRWRIRPWAGVSTIRLGGLDSFPQADIRHMEPVWNSLYGVTVTSRQRTNIDWAYAEGLDLALELDPMVSACARIGRLASTEGRTLTRAEGNGLTVADEWIYDSSMLLAGGGATFHLALAPAWRANIGLFLGAGLATVRLNHRFREITPAGTLVSFDGAAVGDGTTFVPEFSLELEREVSADLSVGATAAVRFGGVESFNSRWDSSYNTLNSLTEVPADTPLRDVDGRLLSADYGGVQLSLWLAAKL